MFTPPVLKREPFTLPDGTCVEVRAMKFSERARLRGQATRIDAGDDAVVLIPRVLAFTVELEGAPLMTAEQWDEYGASHQATVYEIFNRVSSLSDIGGEAAEKN